MTATMNENARVDELLDGVHIIDSDSHFTEPPDLWTARVPSSMHNKVPQMRTKDGVTHWYLGDEMLMGIGGNTLRRGKKKELGTLFVQPWEEVDSSTWNPVERVKLLDEMGVYAQILFSNAVGFSSNTFFGIDDLKQRAMLIQTYNDFLVDVQEQSGGRLFPQPLLPTWDMDLTLKEMVRLQERGMRGFTISDKPHNTGLPGLDSSYFEPMWQLGNDMGLVFNFHIAGGGDKKIGNQTSMNPMAQSNPDVYWDSYGPQRRLAILSSQFYMSNARIILNLCMGNFFDRFPNIKVFSAESGIGWVPFIIEAMEFQLDEMVTDPVEIALQKRRPREYFADHIYVSFWFERSGPKHLIEDIGVHNVLVETDVPHPTCIYPGARERLATSLAHVDAYTRRRVLQDNAAELYNIPLPTA